jgi:SAM-dependent methyltransferase
MLATSSLFIDWLGSPYYHRLYFQRAAIEGPELLKKLLERLNMPKDATVLDAACGTGSVCEWLAQAGFKDITGVDLSAVNIDMAAGKTSPGLQFFQHDLRLPFWINYFHYALLLFNRFGYFRTEREHSNVIRTLSQSLRPGGTLVIDYINVHYAEDHLEHKQEIEIDGVNYYITKWYDETHFYKKILIEDRALKEPLEYTEKIVKMNLGDFNDMLSFNGLQLQDVFGDYQLGAYDISKSPRLLLIAKKQ